MALIDLLNEVKNEYGIDEFANMLTREPNRVLAIMLDSKNFDRSIVTLVIENMVNKGMVKPIVNSKGKSNADAIVDMCIDDCISNGIQKELATEYVYAFADVWGLKYSKRVEKEITKQDNSSAIGSNVNIPSERMPNDNLTVSKNQSNNSGQVRITRASKAVIIVAVIVLIVGIGMIVTSIINSKKISQSLNNLESIQEMVIDSDDSDDEIIDDNEEDVKLEKAKLEAEKAEIEKQETLKKSKESFEKAVAYMEAENYPEAIKCFNEVDVLAENYADAQKNIEECTEVYVSRILEESLVASEAGSLEEACEILEQANSKVKSVKFEVEIKSLKDTITEQKREEERQEAESSIKAYLSEGNYEQAKKVFNDKKELLSDKTKQEYQNSIDGYVRNQLQIVKKKYFESYDTSESISVLKELEKEVGSREDISKYIQVMNSAKELKFKSMKIVAAYYENELSKYIASGENAIDKLGNDRSNALSFWSGGYNFVQFECDGYSQLYFLAVPSVKNWEFGSDFRIAGVWPDGTEKELYKSPYIRKDSSFLPVTIELQGAVCFKIIHGVNSANTFIFDDMCLRNILTEKDFDF